MRLSDAEFKAMNGRIRRQLHKRVEFPLLRRLGLSESAGKDVIELGCGNGLGAELIASIGPRSYVGIDFMPEQIELATKRAVKDARFLVGDATHLRELSDQSADVVVIFGILHHIPLWQQAIRECARLLRPHGCLIVEEPDAPALRGWDRVLRWAHPKTGFSLVGLEAQLASTGFRVEKRVRIPGVFGFYRARRVAS